MKDKTCKGDESKKITPLKAIRLRCIDCSGFELKEVRDCVFDGINDDECPLFPLRMGRGSRATLKRIRDYCLWCCCGQGNEVKLCPAKKCPLWAYRFGKRPKKAPLLAENSSTEGSSEDKTKEGSEYAFFFKTSYTAFFEGFLH